MTDTNPDIARGISFRYRLEPLGRRKLLAWTAASMPAILAATAMVHGGGLLADGDPTLAKAPAGFAEVSQLLVGKRTIDTSLLDAAWAALIQREHDFAARFAALHKALQASSLRDMAQWNSSTIAADPALKATAVAIVSAWYLGLVGEVKDRSEDGPAFITYAGALMWAPTIDVTVIPTYARGRPGYWASKPGPSSRT